MNPIISPIRWTIHDLEALPENEGIRREIIVIPNQKTTGLTFYNSLICV